MFKNIINIHPDLNLTIKAGDLKLMTEEIVKLTHQQFEEKIANANLKTYLSREETAKMLEVDKSTLWRWNKQNYLTHIEVGGKRKYKLSDIQRILGEDEYGNN